MTGNERSLGEVLKEILKKYRLEDHLDETRLVDSWEQVAGKLIATHTTSLRIRSKVLYVSLDSAALRQELSYRKQKLLDMLNNASGRTVLTDIVFR